MDYAERERRRRLAVLLGPSKRERQSSPAGAIFGTVAFLLAGFVVFILIGAVVSEQKTAAVNPHCPTLSLTSDDWNKIKRTAEYTGMSSKEVYGYVCALEASRNR